MQAGIFLIRSLVMAAALVCGMSPVASAQCARPFVPPPRYPHYCVTSTPEQIAACKQEADQLYDQQVVSARREWQRQQLECEAREEQERERRAAVAQRAAAQAEQQRAAAENQRLIAEQQARQAAAEAERQRQETEKARLQAEAASAKAAAAEAEWQQHLVELFMPAPNAPPAVAGGFIFVAFITWATAKALRVYRHGLANVWNDILIEVVSSLISSGVLFGVGFLTEIKWLSVSLLGGLFAITLTSPLIRHT